MSAQEFDHERNTDPEMNPPTVSENDAPQDSGAETGSAENDSENDAAQDSGTETGSSVMEEIKKLKNSRNARIAAAAVAAVLLILYFSYSGWLQFPWMQNRYYLRHGIPASSIWVRDGDDYFYIGQGGKVSEGMQEIDGSRYYFEEETGVMQTGWLESPDQKGKMYFAPGSGKGAIGWTQIGNSTYYFSEQGILQTGWLTIGTDQYYLDEEGRRCTGWHLVDDEKYFFDENGVMQTGWVEIEGKKFLLDQEGHRRTGKQVENGKHYYFDRDGVMQTGWVEIDGEKYFYGDDGTRQTGLVTVDGESFYIEKDGTVRPGWHEDGEERFYVCNDGFVLDPRYGMGNYGRLVIRDAGIDVWLFTGESRDDYQEIVDEENSALVVQERRDLQPVIADRKSQGFDLSGIKEGSSACVIYEDETVGEFVCVRSVIGRNEGTDVFDDEGDSIWKQNEDGLCAYSSAGTSDPQEVVVVFWEPASQEEGDGEETAADEE